MLNYTRRLLVLGCLLLLGSRARAQAIKSPNGQLTLQFALQADGVPTYRLTFKGREVIKTSKLGLELKNAPALTSGFAVARAKSAESRAKASTS